MSDGGKAMGGSAGMNGGGNPQGGSAGMSGMGNPPEPVMIEITDIIDATIESCSVNQNFGSDKTLHVDIDQFCTYAALIQPALDPVPAGAAVTKATLSLDCIETGQAINVSYVNGKWSESMVRWNNRPTVGEPIGTLAACTDLGTEMLDLTDAVVAWLS